MWFLVLNFLQAWTEKFHRANSSKDEQRMSSEKQSFMKGKESSECRLAWLETSLKLAEAYYTIRRGGDGSDDILLIYSHGRPVYLYMVT